MRRDEKFVNPSKYMHTSPPSFYEDDIEKWHKRFESPIKERQEFKQRYMKKMDMNPFKLNTNVKNLAHLSTMEATKNSISPMKESTY